MSNKGLATGPGVYEEITLIIEAGGLHKHDDENAVHASYFCGGNMPSSHG